MINRTPWVIRRRWNARLPQPQQQQPLIAAVRERVHSLSQHRTEAGDEGCNTLAEEDDEIGAERKEDCARRITLARHCNSRFESRRRQCTLRSGGRQIQGAHEVPVGTIDWIDERQCARQQLQGPAEVVRIAREHRGIKIIVADRGA